MVLIKLWRKLLELRKIQNDPIGYAKSIGVQVGKDCRLLGLKSSTFGSEPYLIKIGDHVTITAGVEFVTHDGGVWVIREEEPEIEVFGPIVVGNNTFIGMNSLIMPGVTIGDNCIIGAGSVVTRDIPSGVVAAGIPAKPIKTVEEYLMKTRVKALYIRSLSKDEKRKHLIEHFWGENRPES